MKKLMLIAGILFGSVPLFAAAQPTIVAEVATSSMTTVTITVSTFTPTRMDNPTLSGRVSMEIKNEDATAALWCSPVANVTGSGGAHPGRSIEAKTSWNLGVNFQTITGPPVNPVIAAFHIYCVSDGAAATKAAVSQAY